MEAKQFGQFIAGIRKEKKMTQAELAEKIHVTDKAVSRWERGLGFPDIQTLEPLAQVLGISVLELMRSEKKKPTGDMDTTETQYTQKEVAEMLQNADDISKQLKKQDKNANIIAGILVIGVGVSLSMTVFFNIEQIVVAGDADQPYQKNDVVKASGVHTGDNMMRLNRETVKENILSRLIFVDSVSIQKDFPDRLVITIEPSKAAFNVTDSSGTLQVSAAGKILVSGPDSDPSLPTITGFEASVREPGKTLTSRDSQKDKIFQSLSERIAKGLDCPVTSIDLADKYNINLIFDGRVSFQLGNWSDMDYKITLAETVLGQLSPDKVGYLSMVGDHQCSYRDKEAVEQQTTAPLQTTATDEYGNPVTETDEYGNLVTTETQTETTTTAAGWQ